MRVERENGEHVGPVWAILTPDEASDLLDSLVYYFEEDPVDPGWHHHIGEGHTKLMVVIERPTAAP
jgi:hypothetical protein